MTCTPLRDDTAEISETLVVVTDHTEAQHEADRAERLAAMRSRALATINHKLRGQLNSMLGISELLGTTHLSAKQRAWNGVIASSGQHLLKFVHHLIEFMELDAERFAPVREPFSLRDAMDVTIADHRAGAEAAATTLVARYPLEFAEHFAGDREQVQQILDLLIGVALGTNAGGEVFVNVEEIDHGVEDSLMVLTIEDRGRGLSPEAIDRIFDGLESPSAMWSIRSGGTGLELPIARLLARGMGGDLTVESRINVGTNLRLELPLPRATLIELAARAPSSQTRDARPLHVLLVDDSAVQAEVAGQLLEQLGHQVTFASHGAAAIETLDASPEGIDAILTELHMPVLDGISATNAIRQRTDSYRDLPILAVTSDTRRRARSEALAAGFDGVIEKPLDLASLRDGIAAMRRRTAAAADTAPVIDDPVIDEAVLSRIHDLDPSGEQRLVADLIDAFLDATPRQLLQARDAALALSAPTLDPIARSITTSCRLLGARRLERRTAWLLKSVEAEDLVAARSAADALTAEFALVRRALLAARGSLAA
ncbi:MAG: response regulator [Chloroflexi bacterium]|nr:response regulator [Chloroflexota bacterium]